MLFSLPMGMRTMEPRSVADALIWFGASKCGSRRRYALTLEFSSRQISLPCVNAVHKVPSKAGEVFLALRVPEKVLAIFADRNVRVHAASVHANNRLRQEGGSQPEPGCNLATDQLVDLDLVSSTQHFTIAVIDLKL